MKKILLINKKGFTLIETFVAITILLLAVLGPLGLFSKTLVDVIFAQNQITALYLAQEGLELAINYKINSDIACDPFDPICIEPTEFSWLGDLQYCISNNCTVNFSEPDQVEIGRSNPDFSLYIDENNNQRLVHDSSGLKDKSIFSRKIKLETVDPNQSGVRISSEASWEDPRTGLKRETILETVVYKNSYILYE